MTHKREFVRNKDAKADAKGKSTGKEVHEWLWRVKPAKFRHPVKPVDVGPKKTTPSLRVGSWMEVDAAKLLAMKSKSRAMLIAKEKDVKWNPNDSTVSKRRRLKRLARVQALAHRPKNADVLMYNAMKEGEALGKERARLLVEAARLKAEEQARIEAAESEQEGGQELPDAGKESENKDWVGTVGDRLRRLWKNPATP